MTNWAYETDGYVPGVVDSRWDPHTRSWITTLVDSRGYQIGPAAYSGTRADRATDIVTYERLLAEWKERAG